MSTKLYINDTIVDIEGVISIPYTKAQTDVFHPEARNADFSKTVTIPGTKGNNILFGHIFDVAQSVQNTSTTTNFFPDFNPNLKASFKVYNDGLLAAKGYTQLLRVNVLGENLIEYEICLFGTVGDLFLALGSYKLTDLDFSEFTHTWNFTNIENSWATSIKDNTTVSGDAPFNYGHGYVYPLIYNGEWTSLLQVPETSFKPALFTKTIIDKIFAKAGKSYTSDSFFNDALFKHFIVPYAGSNFTVSETDVINNTAYISRTIGKNVYIGDNLKDGTATGGGSGNYSNASGKYICAVGGFYRIRGVVQALGTDNLSASTEPYELRMRIVVGDKVDYFFNVYTRNGAGGVEYRFDAPPLPADASQEIYISFIHATDGFTGNPTNNNTKYVQMIWNYSVEYVKSLPPIGITVNCNEILPPDVLCKDFLIGICKKFNLCIEESDVENTFTIKTRANYLTNTVHDWSKKLDIGQKIEIQPMGALDANPYYFVDKDGEDLINKLYTKKNVKQYGELKYYINNDFIKDEKKIETIFTPTALYNEANWTSEKVVSYTANFNEKGELIPNGKNLRLLYYEYLAPTVSTAWLVVDVNFNTVATLGDYPYAGHLDDPYSSTIDLNWYTPDEIYYTDASGAAISLTNNNLYKLYYKDFLDEITNKDSKIVRAYFNMNPNDFINAKFSDLYYFMGQYFRLNKIIDYDMTAQKTTLCEFIKTQKPVG